MKRPAPTPDLTPLIQNPELVSHEVRRAESTVTIFIILSLLVIIKLVAGFMSFESLSEISPRRRSHLSEIIPFAHIITAALWAFCASFYAPRAIRGEYAFRLRQTGEIMQTRFLYNFSGGLATAQELGRRLTMGDPRAYLPLRQKVFFNGNVSGRILIARNARLAIATIGVRGPQPVPMPPVFLQGAAYEQLMILSPFRVRSGKLTRFQRKRLDRIRAEAGLPA